MIFRIRSGHVRHEFSPDHIVQVQGVGNYSLFCLADGRRLLSSHTLKLYQGMLPAYFIRVHRGCLVNGYFIKKQISTDRLLLHTGDEVPLSRRNISHFRRCASLLQSTPLAMVHKE